MPFSVQLNCVQICYQDRDSPWVKGSSTKRLTGKMGIQDTEGKQQYFIYDGLQGDIKESSTPSLCIQSFTLTTDAVRVTQSIFFNLESFILTLISVPLINLQSCIFHHVSCQSRTQLLYMLHSSMQNAMSFFFFFHLFCVCKLCPTILPTYFQSGNIRSYLQEVLKHHQGHLLAGLY